MASTVKYIYLTMPFILNVCLMFIKLALSKNRFMERPPNFVVHILKVRFKSFIWREKVMHDGYALERTMPQKVGFAYICTYYVVCMSVQWLEYGYSGGLFYVFSIACHLRFDGRAVRRYVGLRANLTSLFFSRQLSRTVWNRQREHFHSM